MIAEKITLGNIPAAFYKPTGYDATKVYPIVLFLHGKGEMLSSGIPTDTLFDSKVLNHTNYANLRTWGDKLGFCILAPWLIQAYNQWIPGWTEEYVKPFVDWINSNKSLAQDQIYLSGLSLGGGGTWKLASGSYGDQFAAIIPICGTFQTDLNYKLIADRELPVWAWHAKDDVTVSYLATVQTVDAIIDAGAAIPPKVTILASGGHAIWGTVYNTEALYTWMLGWRNNVTKPPVVVPPVTKTILAKYELTVYSDYSTDTKKI